MKRVLHFSYATYLFQIITIISWKFDNLAEKLLETILQFRTISQKTPPSMFDRVLSRPAPEF